MNNKYTKDFILLGAIIIGCSIAARFMAKGETLAEYNESKSVVSDASSTSASVTADAFDASSFTSASITAGAADTSSSNSSSITAGAADTSSSDSASVNSDSSASFYTSEFNYDSDIVTYADGFSYGSLPQNIIDKITGVSYVENDNISIDDLRYCNLLYNDFEGNTQHGELICNKTIAQDIVEIFYELYSSGYQIESIKLIDEYNGDDTASMEANNTSCFNYRVVDGTKKLSKHAYGLAIDLNPFYNPYITYNKDGTTNVSPEGSRIYEDRSSSFPYKIDENDLACKLFKAHGFRWGGDWNSVKDYQHFEKK